QQGRLPAALRRPPVGTAGVGRRGRGRRGTLSDPDRGGPLRRPVRARTGEPVRALPARRRTRQVRGGPAAARPDHADGGPAAGDVVHVHGARVRRVRGPRGTPRAGGGVVRVVRRVV